MPVAGMPDPVKTIDVAPADFPLVVKIAGSDTILYLTHTVEDDPDDDGAVVNVFSVWDGGIMFENDFPL